MSKIKKTTLQFKKQDFYETDYTNPKDCAITRALHRAGLTGYKDCGLHIENKNDEVIISCDNPLYKNLIDKVMAMYSFAKKEKYKNRNGVIQPIEPEDFEYVLPIS